MRSATLLYGDIGAHDQHLAALAEAGDRHEVLHRVVGQLLVEMLVGRVRRVGRDQHRVAVGGGAAPPPARRSCRSRRPCCRRPPPAWCRRVIDVAERARQLVGRAAGGERHDEGDRLVGVLGLRERAGAAKARAARRRRRVGRRGSGSWSCLHGCGWKESGVVGAGEVLAQRVGHARSAGRAAGRTSALPWLSRLSASLTPPSSTSSSTKFIACSFGSR